MERSRTCVRNSWCRLKACAATSLLLLLMVQSVNGEARSGQVVDENTGNPLPGVFVMAIWTASTATPVISHTQCYHFAITQTDNDGRYSLPDFSWNFNPFLWERSRTYAYYLAGYEGSPNNEADAPVWKMRRFVGNAEERLERLSATSFREACMSEHEVKEKLGPLYRAQYEEAKSIATSSIEEKQLVWGMKGRRDRVELGRDEARRRAEMDIPRR